MRLLVISDLHLEFGPFQFPEPMPEFDVAVFAGDLHKPITASLEWLVRHREAGPLRERHIVYVAGNHEFYKSEMKGALAAGRELAGKVGIHLLDRSTVVIGQVRFIGVSDLSAVIEEFQPELWIHGHDHGSHDYMVGRTRVLANQAGYPTQSGTRENLAFDPCCVVEV